MSPNITPGRRPRFRRTRAFRSAAISSAPLVPDSLETEVLKQGVEGTGVYVMDMTDPAKPVHTATSATVRLAVTLVAPLKATTPGSTASDPGSPWTAALLRQWGSSETARPLPSLSEATGPTKVHSYWPAASLHLQASASAALFLSC